MFLSWPSINNVQIILTHLKTLPPESETFFLVYILWGKLFFKTYSFQTFLGRFGYHMTLMVIGRLSTCTKIVQIILIRCETRPPGGGASFPYVYIVKTWKINLLVKKLFQNNLVQNVFGWPSTQLVQIILIGWKTWPTEGRTSCWKTWPLSRWLDLIYFWFKDNFNKGSTSFYFPQHELNFYL